MRTLGLVLNIKELAATPDMLEGIVAGSFITKGGYKVLTKEDIMSVLIESMNQ